MFVGEIIEIIWIYTGYAILVEDKHTFSLQKSKKQLKREKIINEAMDKFEKRQIDSLKFIREASYFEEQGSPTWDTLLGNLILSIITNEIFWKFLNKKKFSIIIIPNGRTRKNKNFSSAAIFSWNA